MRLLKNKTHIYGFEDYNLISTWDSIFRYSNTTYRISEGFENTAGKYLIDKDLPVKVLTTLFNTYWETVTFSPEIGEDHKELLCSANKVYVHPSCHLSRSMAATKYKKSLNPWTADVIVVPEPDYSELSFHKYALFINEDAKIIVKIRLDEDNEDSKIQLEEGMRISDYLHDVAEGWGHIPYSIDDFKNAELFYVGKMLYIPNSHSYILDLLTQSLPSSKIVFEKSLQESLGDSSNILDFDSLVSIKDMLDSSDENTVSVGLKTLSMMDWIHYPNSVRYILSEANSNFKYNSATDSTSVKYMLKTISGNCKRHYWPGSYDDTIYKEDYSLFKKLKMHYEHINENDIMANMRFLNFMQVSSDNILQPRIREAC